MCDTADQPDRGLESQASCSQRESSIPTSPEGYPRWQGEYTHCLFSVTLLHFLLPDQSPCLPTSQSVYCQGSDHQEVAVRNSSPQIVFHPSLWTMNCPLSHAPRPQPHTYAARLVTRILSRAHITPVLQDLHWLPVRQPVLYKVMCLTHGALNSTAPIYLNDLVARRQHSRTLRS